VLWTSPVDTEVETNREISEAAVGKSTHCTSIVNHSLTNNRYIHTIVMLAFV
jgi:hypothetical protein